jgi:hypothetical protein
MGSAVDSASIVPVVNGGFCKPEPAECWAVDFEEGDGVKFVRVFCCLPTILLMHRHISDRVLERYHLGMVRRERELARIEEHYLGCPRYADRAERAADCVDMLRAAIIEGNFDLEYCDRPRSALPRRKR